MPQPGAGRRLPDDHDLVHSYSPAFVHMLADLDVPTLSTLTSYVPVCPKGDLLYHDETKCSGPRVTKCVGCVLDASSALKEASRTASGPPTPPSAGAGSFRSRWPAQTRR